MYRKPKDILTAEEYEEFVGEWGEDIAERGYAIFDCNGTGILGIERIDEIFVGRLPDGSTDVTDEDCARHAQRTGFCKIIPKKELPRNFEWRYYCWLDTPENRENIRRYCDV